MWLDFHDKEGKQMDVQGKYLIGIDQSNTVTVSTFTEPLTLT